MHAQIVLFDGFDPLDVIAPYEVLTSGGDVAGGALTVEFASAEGAREVPSGLSAISLRANAQLDPEQADIIIVPGAVALQVEAIPPILARVLETPFLPLIGQALARPDVTVATVCGGSTILAMAGLLVGRHVVTHHMAMESLAVMGAIPTRARVVDEGDLVTSGGVTSGLDLGLYLLERELGPRIARAVEEMLEYERRGTTWRNTGLTPRSV